MYQKTKKYKVWLQEHNESTSIIQDDFPMNFTQEYNKFHAFWDCQEANIVQDLLPATGMDAVFTMIERYVKYLKEVQSENKFPSAHFSSQAYVLPIKNFNKKMESFNCIAYPVKHTCFMTTLQGKQLITVQNKETEANNYQELAEKPTIMLHISKDWPTPTGSVHSGTLPTVTSVSMSTCLGLFTLVKP